MVFYIIHSKKIDEDKITQLLQLLVVKRGKLRDYYYFERYLLLIGSFTLLSPFYPPLWRSAGVDVLHGVAVAIGLELASYLARCSCACFKEKVYSWRQH